MTTTTQDIDTLYDSDTNEMLTADDLGISEERYEELVQESVEEIGGAGHVDCNGRQVYAAK